VRRSTIRRSRSIRQLSRGPPALRDRGDRDPRPIALIAIGIGHDVTRYYGRSVTIVDAEELGGAMTEKLAEPLRREGLAAEAAGYWRLKGRTRRARRAQCASTDPVCRKRTVNPISRPQPNGDDGADSGPSRGDARTRAPTKPATDNRLKRRSRVFLVRAASCHRSGTPALRRPSRID
jgi:Cobalamin biosynthesis protein CobT VWA domain